MEHTSVVLHGNAVLCSESFFPSTLLSLMGEVKEVGTLPQNICWGLESPNNSIAGVCSMMSSPPT